MNLLQRLKINEVSMVDKGANPGALITLFKRDFTQEERDAAASSGAALPDGSYPIKTVQDLKNAVQAYGRAKNKAKVKAHIISRAKTLGATDSLPEGWMSDTKKGLFSSEQVQKYAARIRKDMPYEPQAPVAQTFSML